MFVNATPQGCQTQELNLGNAWDGNTVPLLRVVYVNVVGQPHHALGYLCGVGMASKRFKEGTVTKRTGN